MFAMPAGQHDFKELPLTVSSCPTLLFSDKSAKTAVDETKSHENCQRCGARCFLDAVH